MELNLLLVLVFTAVLVFISFFAALRSAESMEDVHNEQQPQLVWAAFLIVGTIMGLSIKFMPPIVYAIILILIAGLQWLNHEGWKRRQSWNLLAIGYSFMLIISVVAHRNSLMGLLRWTTLLWLIPIVAPFVVGAVQSARLNRDGKTGVELSGRIIPWAIAAVCVITLIIVIALKF